MSAEKAVKFGEDTPLGRAGQPAELQELMFYWRQNSGAT